MAGRMNHDRLRHSGRATEEAFAKDEKPWDGKGSAKAANAGGSLSDEKRASIEVPFDENERDRLSTSRELITLIQEPVVRETEKGRVIVFRGTQEGRSNPITAAMRAPVKEKYDEGVRDELDGRLRSMSGGDMVSLAGKWSMKKWEQNGVPRQAWEFQAQRFREGDFSLEQIRNRDASVEQGQPRISPVVAAMAHDRAGRSAG